MDLNVQQRIVLQWSVFITVAATVFTFTVNTFDSTFLKSFVLVIGSLAILLLWIFYSLSRLRVDLFVVSFHIALAGYWLASSMSIFRSIRIQPALESLVQLTC